MSVVGIDFGNLQSCIAVARNRGIDVIVNEVSNRFTPSLVGFGAKQRYLGEGAKTQEISNLKNTVGSLKRLIGRPFSDPTLQYEQQFLNVKIVEASKTECGIEVDYLGKPTVFTATQLVAMYLGKIRDITSEAISGPVTDCVISVPGWFAESQRRAMLEAAEIAGLNPLRIMNDGTSSALAYGITKTDLPAPESPRYVVFVDVGHSNSSVTVASFYKGGLHIVGSAYDSCFGGREFDKLLVDTCVTEFKETYKMDIASNGKAMFRLYAGVEKAKKVLSANQQAPLNIEAIMNDRDVSTMLQRSEFESMIAPLLAKLQPLIEKALASANLTKDQIDFVETIGGTTRIPIVKETIQNFFSGKTQMTSTLNQDEAVARGCALQCAIISPVFKVRDFAVNDICSYPIKLTWTPSPNATEQESGNSVVVFPRNASVPSTKILTFYRRDTSFDLEVHYDELPPVVQQSWIGRYTVKKIPAKPDDAEPVTVKVKARMNLNGLVSIESASYVTVEYVPVPEEPKPATPAADNATTPAADPKTPNGDAMETEETKDSEENKESTTEEKKPKMKKNVKLHDLSLVGGVMGLDKADILKLRETELSLHATDKLVFDTEVAKNTLEEYIYDIRGKLEDSYRDYMVQDEREVFMKKLNDSEDWLYSDEGEDATKSVYVSKLNELKASGDPIVQRYRESEDRPVAEKRIRELIGNLITVASSNDPNYSHIPMQEMQSIAQKATEDLQWLENKLDKLRQLPKHAPVPISVDEINKKYDELNKFSQTILSKPKPVEKKEEPKPAEGESAEKKELPKEEPAKQADEMEVD